MRGRNGVQHDEVRDICINGVKGVERATKPGKNQQLSQRFSSHSDAPERARSFFETIARASHSCKRISYDHRPRVLAQRVHTSRLVEIKFEITVFLITVFKMSRETMLLHCYNRGCGKKFDPNDNKEGDCVHHPGHPVFHDAYKGWSCCNKKCTDFTEFLNIKGCTKSFHSNVKPPEPEKPAVDKSKANEVIKVIAKPLMDGPILQRPPFETSQVTLTPNVSPTLLEQIKGLTSLVTNSVSDSKVQIGQSCKNNSCKATYRGPASDDEVCNHHPGTPIFHEGLKFWSCCQKRTTDFSTFLEQPGCTQGKHTWISTNTGKKVKCRMDWHQTGAFVVVSVYAKKYQPDKSTVKLNPIRLTIDLFFIEENSRYNLDLELRGVVDVAQSSVSMLPTKVEIKLKKAEVGSWAKLDFPRENEGYEEENSQNDEENNTQVDAVDLSDL
ncbi:cysteine and histidine-rich domain-containing protein isoform X3 [Ceratina calcarata]|nr:cysteine and histidine-rich domain-containing protein isoform X3 [Ceratina calcarata]